MCVRRLAVFSKDSTCMNDYGGRKYYTKHTNGHMLHFFLFFLSIFTCFWVFFFLCDPSLCSIMWQKDHDKRSSYSLYSVCHEISGRRRGAFSGEWHMLENKVLCRTSLKISQLDSMFLDLVYSCLYPDGVEEV